MDASIKNLSIKNTVFGGQFTDSHQKTQVVIEAPNKFLNSEEVQLNNSLNVKEAFFRRSSVIEHSFSKM